MASISANDLAGEILDTCLNEGTWRARTLEALVERALDEEDPMLAQAATRALFGVLVERLADLFEPDLCDVYARLFTYVIGRALPDFNPSDLLVRYRAVRQLRPFSGGEVLRVYVLSRVTLGADVAVTSVAISAAKQRFPGAQIFLVGPAKNAELFAADPQVVSIPVQYGRASLLRERLFAAVELHTLVEEAGAIVIDPDSRLTQLGLIPICDDSRYYFFESRSFGGGLDTPLPVLTAEWLAEVFDVSSASPYLAPVPQDPIAEVTVSFGVGENSGKSLGHDFEKSVLQALLRRGKPILLDRGAGGAEADRVNALVEELGHPPLLHLHDGSYASFASHILQSKLYVGYDSAGQHVASAGRVPLVSTFAGFVCQRMLERWRPNGKCAHVIRVDESGRANALERTLAAISEAEARE